MQYDTYHILQRFAKNPTEKNWQALDILIDMTQRNYLSRALSICGSYNLDSNKALGPMMDILLGHKRTETTQKLDVEALYEQALKSFGMQRTDDGKLVKLPGTS